jgi:hypothetical protein
MTKLVCARNRAVRIALLGALALLTAPFVAGQAVAKVGVTSATDGDPLGKPPQEAERVLRIGVDVQANELITTNANDRAHLLFLDGSSLTVGPNAQLTIDKFVFDPTTKTGELAINASKGVLRLVGGKISKNGPILITTPANTVGIRGGITILDVKANQTDSTFVFGKDMTVRAAGQTQVATRPGSMIVTNLGGPPGLPTILAQGALNAQLAALEGRRSSQSSSSGSGSGGGNPDQVAQSSGLSGINSSQSVRVVAPGVPDNFGSGPGPRNRNPNDTIVTALSDANQSTQTNTSKQTQPQTQTQDFSLPIHDKIDLGLFDFRGLGLDFNGRLATVSELANLNQQRATATYNGPVQAFVNNNYNSPVGGSYQNVWNFGNRNGVVTVKLDGSTYGGGTMPNVSLTGNGPFFSSNGAIQSTSGPAGRSMNVEGLFVSTPSGGPAKQQVGVIGATGPNNYNAIGAFVGTR